MLGTHCLQRPADSVQGQSSQFSACSVHVACSTAVLAFFRGCCSRKTCMGKSAAATLYLWCVSWPDCVFHRVDAQERLNRKESKCRGRSVQENLAIWEEMKKGSEVGVMNCLRFKFDMKVRAAGFGPAGSWRQTKGPLQGSTLPWV